MENITAKPGYELIYIVINRGLGSRVMKTARHCGILKGTVLMAKGTVSSRVLELLGLSDVRKEIVLMAADKNTARQTLEALDGELGFDKPNNGIAFTTSVCGIFGEGGCPDGWSEDDEGVENAMYHAITVIVEKGRAEDVIDAAVRAGSKGGTIINARGSGIHQTSRLFSMDIEPEKEMVLILSESHMTDGIVASVREHLKIDEPGNGIIYVQDIKKTYGLYK